MKISVSFLLLTLGFSLAWGQREGSIDSLKFLLSKQNDVKESVRLSNELFEAYLYSSPDSANAYRKFIKKLAEKENYAQGMYLYNSLSGKYHYAKSQLDSAYFYIEEASIIAEQLDNKAYLADCYKKMGVIHNVRRNDSLSKKYAQMALENARLTDDWRLLSSIYILLGNQSFQLTNYPEALTHYLKLDSIYTSHGAQDKSLAAAYSNIGMIYSELKDSNAVAYIKKSIDIYKAIGHTEGVHYGEYDLGTYYQLQKNFKKAIEHLLKAKDFYEEYENAAILSRIYRMLGTCYLGLNDNGNAEYYLTKLASLPEGSQDIPDLAGNHIMLGELYRNKEDYENAISHFQKSLEILQQQKSEGLKLYLLNAYQGLIDTYKDLGDFKAALELTDRKAVLRDSVQKTQNQLVVEELNRKYQNEKQEQEIQLLTSQSQLVAQKAQNQRNLFTGGIFILGLALITLFILFRNKQKTNQRLKQLESTKSKFFANISHEFRTPLTLISGPVAHQLSKKGLTPDDKTDLVLIQRNANRLLNLVNQVLDLSKIESGHRKLRVSKGNMELFLKHLSEPFEYQASQKGMVWNGQIDIPDDVWFDREVVEKIVTNLLSNAVKYNLERGEISFDARLEDNNITITVANENVDLKESELPLLFDRFYQGNSLKQGFGIGLSLVKELVLLSKGKIKVSKLDIQTIAFHITLPVSKSIFSKEELSNPDKVDDFVNHFEKEIFDDIDKEEELTAASLPVLLIVDDNEEIRLFIKSLFKKEYHILEAENGEKGVAIALETIPDLIISDVMMPVKDGIYLSNTLKSDERTSHIPIVLLTAKSGEENELVGLKTGADAYMLKPFAEEKLRVTIEKLIATRTAIQEKFSKQLFLEPKGIQLANVDAKLMKRIQQILDTELTNPEFSAQLFSDQVGLSRMHLHRKLKALTGLSTSEFIRTQRLKLAAKILKEGHANISEVGYAVGFNQPAYFSTAFKQHFGRSPSEYMALN